MADQARISKLALRKDKILEIPWPVMVDPPEELMKIPGFRQYHDQQKLYMERVHNVFNNLVNNLGVSTSTP